MNLPEFRPLTPTEPVRSGVLQGLSHVTQRVSWEGNDCVEQVPRLLGGDDVFDRRLAWSLFAHNVAAVAPAVRVYDRERQSIVTDFVPGRRPAPDAVSLNRALSCLKAVRGSANAPSHRMDPYEATRANLRELRKARVLSEQETDRFEEALREVQVAVGKRALPNVPSHNDFTLRNLLDDGTQAWLIDWETGGWNDPFYDPATMIASHGLGREHQSFVMNSIWPDAVERDRAHFDLMRFVTSLESAAWCLVAHTKNGAPNFKANGLRHLTLPRAWIADGKVQELAESLMAIA